MTWARKVIGPASSKRCATQGLTCSDVVSVTTRSKRDVRSTSVLRDPHQLLINGPGIPNLSATFQYQRAMGFQCREPAYLLRLDMPASLFLPLSPRQDCAGRAEKEQWGRAVAKCVRRWRDGNADRAGRDRARLRWKFSRRRSWDRPFSCRSDSLTVGAAVLLVSASLSDVVLHAPQDRMTSRSLPSSKATRHHRRQSHAAAPSRTAARYLLLHRPSAASRNR